MVDNRDARQNFAGSFGMTKILSPALRSPFAAAAGHAGLTDIKMRDLKTASE